METGRRTELKALSWTFHSILERITFKTRTAGLGRLKGIYVPLRRMDTHPASSTPQSRNEKGFRTAWICQLWTLGLELPNTSMVISLPHQCLGKGDSASQFYPYQIKKPYFMVKLLSKDGFQGRSSLWLLLSSLIALTNSIIRVFPILTKYIYTRFG